MTAAKNPNPPIKDDAKPAGMGVQPRPGTYKPRPKPVLFTDFALI